MAEARNCAWLPEPVSSNRVIWTRNGVFTHQCPKSIISSQSLMFIEHFRYWKRFGGGAPWQMDSKTAEALLLLDQLFKAEEHYGEQEGKDQ